MEGLTKGRTSSAELAHLLLIDLSFLGHGADDEAVVEVDTERTSAGE
jgi:hypothetical protein